MKTHKQHKAELRQYRDLAEAQTFLDGVVTCIPGLTIQGRDRITGQPHALYGDECLEGIVHDLQSAHDKLTACLAEWNVMWAKHEDVADPVSSMRVTGALA